MVSSMITNNVIHYPVQCLFFYSLGRLSRINEIPLCILTFHFTVADKAVRIQTSTETSYYNALDLNSSLQSTKDCLIHFTISYEVAFQSRQPLFTKLESQLSVPHKYSQNAQGWWPLQFKKHEHASSNICPIVHFLSIPFQSHTSTITKLSWPTWPVTLRPYHPFFPTVFSLSEFFLWIHRNTFPTFFFSLSPSYLRSILLSLSQFQLWIK